MSSSIPADILLRLQEWCAEAERAPMDLKRKLMRMKLDISHFPSILERLETAGFMSSERYILAFIDRQSRIKKWGKKKIQQALLTKGLSSRPDHFERAGFTEEEGKIRLIAILQKKNSGLREPDPAKRKAKLIRFALSRGYTLTDILSVLKTINHS
jgi:regulatory protein